MIKKIFGIVLVIIIAVGLGGYFVVKKMASEYDQINLQYDNEKISSLKSQLDYEPYEQALIDLGEDRLEQLNNLVLSKSAVDVQKLIQTDDMTVEELVLVYVDRIRTHNNKVNAILQLNPLALEQAKALDQKKASGDVIGNLFGQVITIKDNIASVDMNTAAGTYALKSLTTDRDAFLVNTLKEEDAIILAKANLSEWSNFMSSPSSNGFSVLGGQTKNPYGFYDVGGSSSGSSVASALNLSSVTLGSETAGSLIYPAGQNSVVAIKPSMGALSRDLIVPISEAQDTAGIIGRTVEDVFQVYKFSVAKDSNDPEGNQAILVNESLSNLDLNLEALKGKKLGFVNDANYPSEQVLSDLEKMGIEVVPVEMPQDKAAEIDMMTVLNYGIVHDVHAFLNHPSVKSDYDSLERILTFYKEAPESRMPYGALLHEEALKLSIDKDVYEQIVDKNKRIASELIDGIIKENNLDALVSFSNGLSGIYAPAMYPAVTVPSGYKSTGEPFGITFVGTLGSDADLLNYAYAYEQATKYRENPAE